jgi:SAM-dependent methyltransferase
LPTDGLFRQPFDLVYTFRFIRHFQLADRQRLYAQIRRVLRPGGLLLFDAVNAVVSRPLREAHPEEYPIYDELYDTLEDLRTELNRAEFELTDQRVVQRGFRRQQQVECLLGPRCRWLSRFVIRVLEQTSRGPGLEWIVTCRRA